jgi:hypothetical protein
MHGKTIKQIGDQLYLSQKTCQNYVSNVLLKLKTHSIADAVKRARKLEMFEFEDQDAARVMTKELFFLAGHPAPLHDAAAELRRAGFLIRSQPHDLGGTWSLMAYAASSELSETDLATLYAIAERCGVEFDGWGTYVGPPERDEGPGGNTGTTAS